WRGEGSCWPIKWPPDILREKSRAASPSRARVSLPRPATEPAPDASNSWGLGSMAKAACPPTLSTKLLQEESEQSSTERIDALDASGMLEKRLVRPSSATPPRRRVGGPGGALRRVPSALTLSLAPARAR